MAARRDTPLSASAAGAASGSSPQHVHGLHPEPTLLETQLDSIALALTKMKSRLHRVPVLEHLSDAERAELHVALTRVKHQVAEVDELITRGQPTLAAQVH